MRSVPTTVRVRVVWDADADHLATKVRRCEHEPARHDAPARSRASWYTSCQEQVERSHALSQTALDRLPFGRGQDSRQQIERKDAFDAGLLAVHRERDALLEKGRVGVTLPLPQRVRRQMQKAIEQALVRRTRLSGTGEHLVVTAVELGPLEQACRRFQRGAVRRMRHA